MSKVSRWKCEVCGYIHEGDFPPDSCPVCGADKEAFTPFEAVVQKPQKVSSWKCSVCGYEQGEKPQKCAVCGAGKDLFIPSEKEAKETSSDTKRDLVIIGAGIAGFTAAEQARQSSQNASITLISKEQNLPYYRLNLTRYLAGDIEEKDLLLQSQTWYDENNIKLVFDEAKSIDPESKKVNLESGKSISYDRLILANGSHPFIPPIEGNNIEGVFELRTIEDAKKIIEYSKGKKSCICIGGGLLGLETSGALNKRGLNVTVLEGFGWLLPRQLPKTAGLKLKDYVVSTGVNVESMVKTTQVTGDDSVKGVKLEDGRTLSADMIIISTGIRANSYLARKSGLKVGNGVLVDDSMSTSDSNIYAAGDVAEHAGIMYGIWPASYAQGMVAGINAAGGNAEFPGMAHSTRLKVLDVDVFSIGKISFDDASYKICEKDMGDSYHYFACRDGNIIGAVLYGDTEMAQIVKDAVEKKIQIADLPELLKKVPELSGN